MVAIFKFSNRTNEFVIGILYMHFNMFEDHDRCSFDGHGSQFYHEGSYSKLYFLNSLILVQTKEQIYICVIKNKKINFGFLKKESTFNICSFSSPYFHFQFVKSLQNQNLLIIFFHQMTSISFFLGSIIKKTYYNKTTVIK